MSASRPNKTPYYVLEGSNSFATSYYFNYLLFQLHNHHGFRDQDNLAVGAFVGALYAIFCLVSGRFGQKRGYFASLRVGFGGMFVAIGLSWALVSVAVWLQILAVGLWMTSVCFTWPMLEALVSEHEAPDNLPRRLGIYNVVWGVTAACGYFFGGVIFERFGAASLYWLPMTIHGLQFLATFSLQRRHDEWLRHETPVQQTERHHEGTHEQYLLFRNLAWLGNPLNYMALNTVLAVAPGIASHIGLTVTQAGFVLGVWYWVRAAAFAVLWQWHGWHYRFSWFIGSLAALLISFVAILNSHTVVSLLVAQLGFGFASALIYYSSLFYALDGSDTKAEHGGVHEALIGIGIFGGPALSSAASTLSANPAAPTWAVGSILTGGLVAAMAIRAKAHVTDS